MRARIATLLVVWLALAPGCIVLSDEAGVPVTRAQAASIVPGRTTRAETLALMGPPTGTFNTNLLAIITRLGIPIEVPLTPGRIDEDVFAWQQVEVKATVTFFPILFLWVNSAVRSRTLIVFFDERGVVRYQAFREDES